LVTFFLAKKESDPAAQRTEALRFAHPVREPDFARIGKRCAIVPSMANNRFFSARQTLLTLDRHPH
jgi:hypothetical protein